jgi:hypothetical protein
VPAPTAHPLPELPPAFDATRAALHLVAARVLAAARYAAAGRLGLVVVPGGFATPAFDGRRLLVVDGLLTDGHRRQPFTTLADACAFASVDPTAPTHPVLELPADPDAPLAVDIAAAAVLAGWLARCQTHLEDFLAAADPTDAPSAITLWPEHFDLALEMGPPESRANYGGSPGDDTVDEPYLYVGPHTQREGPFWNVSFGAVLTYGQIRAGADEAQFLAEGRARLRAE